MEWKKLLDLPKLLKRWSGRPGLEPATSSLGNWANIVNTDFSVSGSDFKRRKITEFPILCSVFLLMEYKRSTRLANWRQTIPREIRSGVPQNLRLVILIFYKIQVCSENAFRTTGAIGDARSAGGGIA